MSLVNHLFRLIQNKVPGQLIIQVTDKCNGLCPQCGMRATEKYPRSILSTDHMKRIIDAAAENGVSAISFTGGEPLLCFDALVEMINYAGRAGIGYIRTGTNGFIFRGSEDVRFSSRIHRLAEKLADTPIRNFWISIDSADPSTHEKIRGFPGIIKGIEKAMPIFHDHGIYPSANLGINRSIGRESHETFYDNYRMGFRDFFSFIIDLGFTISSACYPMGGDNGGVVYGEIPVYGAYSLNSLVNFTAFEKAWLFKALMDEVIRFRSKLRILSPLSALHSLHRKYMDNVYTPLPCRGGLDFFFISAKQGLTYPCGYRSSENLGSYWTMSRSDLDETPYCNLCDWECFRDPSEFFGLPLLGIHHPLDFVKKISKDMDFIRLWLSDFIYYRKCDFFDGRRPPRYERFGTKIDTPTSTRAMKAHLNNVQMGY